MTKKRVFGKGVLVRMMTYEVPMSSKDEVLKKLRYGLLFLKWDDGGVFLFSISYKIPGN